MQHGMLGGIEDATHNGKRGEEKRNKGARDKHVKR